MNKEDIKVGMAVLFGRAHGEMTLGEVLKINRMKVKVVQLAERGVFKKYPAGTHWMVPPSLLTATEVPAEVLEQGRLEAAKVEKPIVKDIEAEEEAKTQTAEGTQTTATPPQQDGEEAQKPEPRKRGPKAKAAKAEASGTEGKTPKKRGPAKGTGGRKRKAAVEAKAVVEAPVPVSQVSASSMLADREGCPVLFDPSSGLQLVGHKGESVAEFANRVRDLTGGGTPPAPRATETSEKAQGTGHHLH